MSERRYSSDPTERARQLVAEGRFGGRQPGAGRPRKPRVGTILAERAAAEADTIWNALMSAMTEGTPRQRAEAAERLLRIVAREHELQQRESRDEAAAAIDLAQLDGAEVDRLREYLAVKLGELYPGGPAELLAGEVIEGRAVEPDAA